MDIEVRIRGLMMDPATNMPIVVLKDVGSDAVMPIKDLAGYLVLTRT